MHDLMFMKLTCDWSWFTNASHRLSLGLVCVSFCFRWLWSGCVCVVFPFQAKFELGLFGFGPILGLNSETHMKIGWGSGLELQVFKLTLGPNMNVRNFYFFFNFDEEEGVTILEPFTLSACF